MLRDRLQGPGRWDILALGAVAAHVDVVAEWALGPLFVWGTLVTMMVAKRDHERPHTRRLPKDVVAAVRPIASELADVHGLVLWDMAFKREAGRETLRVACDRVGGVGSDELALYADDLSRELDHSEVVPGDRRYVLEVTSPGAERRLLTPVHFQTCIGRDARLTLSDGRVVEGKLGETTDNTVEVETSTGPVRVFFEDIARAQLVLPGGIS